MARNAHHRDVLVLCYHAVSEQWDDALAVTPQRLAAQVSALLARGYVATTFSAAVLDPPAGRTLAITFDDACGSVLRRAKPILDRLGVPATVFAPSGWVGEPTPMRWAGIEQHAAGLGSLRAEQRTANRFLAAAPQADEPEDFAGSRDRLCQAGGKPCR